MVVVWVGEWWINAARLVTKLYAYFCSRRRWQYIAPLDAAIVGGEREHT